MPVLKHVHSYVRPRGLKVYVCGDPHCSHQCIRTLLLGKASRCPSCGTEFVLNWELLRRAIPKCTNCSNTKEARQKRKIKALLEGLMGDQENESRFGEGSEISFNE